jgi:hypothetical protein
LTVLPDPSKSPTPSEYAVIAVCISGLIIVSVAGLVVALFAPPQKHAVAAALTHYAGWSLGIGVFVGLAYWLVRRFTD